MRFKQNTQKAHLKQTPQEKKTTARGAKSLAQTQSLDERREVAAHVVAAPQRGLHTALEILWLLNHGLGSFCSEKERENKKMISECALQIVNKMESQ